MRNLRDETGAAIMLITHDLGVIAELAQEVVVMYAGKVVERVAVAALFADPQHPYTVGLLGSIPKLHGEQDRLANVVAVIVSRADFDLDSFQSWLADLDAKDQTVWGDLPPKLQPLTRFQNDSYMLRAVVPQILQRPSTPASLAAQQALLKSLQRR